MLTPTLVGLLFAVVFTATAAAVLMAMAEVARPGAQGGRVAVAPGWTPAPIPATTRRRPAGRHRR